MNLSRLPYRIRCHIRNYMIIESQDHIFGHAMVFRFKDDITRTIFYVKSASSIFIDDTPISIAWVYPKYATNHYPTVDFRLYTHLKNIPYSHILTCSYHLAPNIDTLTSPLRCYNTVSFNLTIKKLPPCIQFLEFIEYRYALCMAWSYRVYRPFKKITLKDYIIENDL